MADVEYCKLNFTASDINKRLEDVENLNQNVKAIGEYNKDRNQSTGYIQELQGEIKTVDDKISGLNITYVTRADFQRIESTVNSQGEDIRDNLQDIKTLQAKTLGVNQPIGQSSLQDQIYNLQSNKVNISDFENLKANTDNQIASIKNKNSEQDSTLTAIGRIEDKENGQKGSGELRKLQQIIESYGAITTLQNDINTLKSSLEALQLEVKNLRDTIGV